MIKAVIFDMDGLLLDTERPSVDAWLQAAGDLGLDLTEDVVLKTIGIDWPGTMLIVREALGDGAPLEQLRDLVGSHYRSRLTLGVPVKPGAEALLMMLRERGIPAGLATSTARRSAEWKLESAGLLQYLSGGACGDEVQRGKPYPDIFELAAANIGVDPACCAALEDSPAGIAAAKSAGMTTILVPDLVKPGPEASAHADYIVNDLTEAGKLLLKLF